MGVLFSLQLCRENKQLSSLILGKTFEEVYTEYASTIVNASIMGVSKFGIASSPSRYPPLTEELRYTVTVD